MDQVATGLRRELGRFEQIVVVTIVLLLIGLAVRHMLPVFAEAERATLEASLANMRTALRFEYAARMARGDLQAIADMDHGNAMALAYQAYADSYLGALTDPDPAQIDGGQWYFDLQQHLLIYRVSSAGAFESALPGPPRARFDLQLLYTDRNNNGTFDIGIDSPYGAKLAKAEPYRWKQP